MSGLQTRDRHEEAIGTPYGPPINPRAAPSHETTAWP
jgi:hypothetical protein